MTRALLSLIAVTVVLPVDPLSAGEAEDQYAVAAGHYAAQRWELAAEEFQRFLDKYPDHPKRKQGIFFLAEAFVQIGKYSEASDLFQRCLKLEAHQRLDRPALFRAGEAAYLAEKYDSAKVDLERFRKQYPGDQLNAFVLPYLGEIALAGQDFVAAEAYFREGLQQFPEGKLQDDCRLGLARVLEKQGNNEEAERWYLAVAGKAGSRLAEEAQFRLGAVQYAAGKYAEAVKTFEPFDAGLAGSPRRGNALLGSGWALVKLDRLAEARKCFEKVASDPKVGTEARYWLGWVQKVQNELDAASKTLLEAAEADPKHELVPAIRFQAGDALLRAGKAASALEQFEQVLAVAPPDNAWIDDAMRGRVQAALLSKDHDALDRYAAEFAERCADSPLHVEVHRLRAHSLLGRKQYEAAAELLEPLVKSAADGRTAEDRYLLSLAYEGLRRYDDALATLTPVLESSQPRLKSDALLAKASILLATQRFAEAVGPLESFLADRPKDDEAAVKGLGQLTICYARTGQIDRAKQLYVEMINEHGSHELLVPTTEQLAEAAYDAGEKEWANKLFAWLASDGQSPECRRKGLSGLAWSQFKSGKLEEAAATFDRLLQTHPDPPMAAEAALVRGEILEQLDQDAAALAMFDLVIDRYSQTDRCAEALWRAARLRDDLEQDEEAAGLYRRLAESFPQFPEIDAVLYRWGWALADSGKKDESTAVFGRLFEEHPKSTYWADTAFRLGQRAFEARDLVRARKFVAAILERAADDTIRENALYLRGQIDASERNWAEAQRAFEQQIAEYPQGSLRRFAEYGLAEAAFRQGQYEAAEDRFRQLTGQTQGPQEPWLAEARLRLAQTLCHQEKWDEAYDVASKIESEYPDFAEQYEADYVIGRCLANRADFDAARKAYRKVIRSPNGEKTETAAKAQLMIAESYYHQKDYQAALREYLRLEILYAYPVLQASAVMQAALCHELLGEWKQAAELYQRLLDHYPASEFAAKARDRLGTARQHAAKPAF